jgi:hypothetical protein
MVATAPVDGPGRPPRPRGTGERGLLATEMAILMPIVLLIALVAVYASQVGRHGSRAQAAADAAARAASFHVDDPDGAEPAALVAASRVCQGPVNIEDFVWEPPALDTLTPGRVVVALTCTEQFSGFAPLVADGPRTEGAMAVAALEYWRPSP